MSVIDTKKTDIGISNRALDQLGVDPISGFIEDSKTARTVAIYFQIAKEEVLREFVFDWSHKAEKLVPFADDEKGYIVPADYIDFIGLGYINCYCCCSTQYKNLQAFSHKIAVRQVNGRLYIDSCCQYNYFHYVYNNQNYESMPSDLLVLIVFRLAYLMCMPLTGNLQMQGTLLNQYEIQSLKTKKHAGMEHRNIAKNTLCKTYPFCRRY